MATPNTRPYTFGSLFTGIGGIDLAFVRAGFDVSFQVEIDDYCRKVLAKHAPEYWPNAQVFEDVRHVGSSNLPNVDVLGGGFPCQDISAAGKRAGIKEGTRSGLWFEFARIIGEIRPRVVMLENVAAITSRDGVRVIADLAALGYDAEWGIISAANVGATHKRERWWCIASRGMAYAQRERRESRALHVTDQSQAFPTGTPDTSISGDPNLAYSESNGWDRRIIGGEDSPPITSLTLLGTGVALGNASSPRLEGADRSQSTQPQSTRSGGRQAQSILGRAIDGLPRQLDASRWPARPGQPQYEWEAPRTAEKHSDRSARIKALGNAVVPQVVQPIAEAIFAYIKEADSQASAPTGDAPETTVASVEAVQS